MGIGNICHVDPTGRVPSDTNVDLSGSMVPLDIIMLESSAKGMGVAWKHSSRGRKLVLLANASTVFSGHSLYW
jgi:hypothetical protein